MLAVLLMVSTESTALHPPTMALAVPVPADGQGGDRLRARSRVASPNCTTPLFAPLPNEVSAPAVERPVVSPSPESGRPLLTLRVPPV